MVMESLQRLDPPRRLGKLTLLARLGEGGMASVYVATVGDGPLARLAAVKLLRAGVPDMDYRGRFEDEAKVVVRLHHNNIVDVREAGDVDDQLYILMELIEGRDLSDVWDRCAERGKAFPIPIAVHMLREILRGLHYAHTFPGLALVHRDISPSNILIDWAGAVRLADFGLATSAMKASMTVPGVVFGKVGYMAPEQALSEELDGRADVYSCGVVLWELITGRPLRGAGIDTQAVADWKAARPSALSKRVDGDLDAIVHRALSNDRRGRYETAEAFLQALTQWLATNAPETTQETVAAFMLRLFGEAREKDHAAYSALLEHAPRTAEFRRGTRSTRDLVPPTYVEKIPPGTELAERYRVERTLGRGGMGVVYLAEHIGVGRQVAVKVLTHDWSRHEVVARRFKEEARAANAANHPNIVEVYDAGRLDDGRLYMAMEYLTGRSLYEEICEVGPLSPLRTCEVMGAVADAIGAAHHVGIVHRDLKPDNVMLVPEDDGYRVKVLDFGISASAVRSAEEQRLTRPGHCVGTPEYMAPEQAKGHDPTPRFDVYALGVMIYEALCGDPPFISENMVEVLTRKATEPPPPLAERVKGLPAALVQLCHACIEVDPQRRPKSADDVAQALQSIGASLQSGTPLPTAATTEVDMVVRPSKPAVSESVPAARRRRLWVGAAALIAVIGVGLSAWQLSVARARRSDDSIAAASSSPGSAPVPPAQSQLPPEVEEKPKAVEVPSDPRPSQPEPEPEPESESDAAPESESEAAPELAPDSEPEPESKPAARKTPAAQTRACAQTRAEALGALKRADHRTAYKQSKPKKCWKGHQRDRTRVFVEAAFQLGKYAECVKAGERSKDPKVKRTVATCRLK
ncbi:MAG: protein kinase domain-containing protein [Nannocystales bacterium]